MIVRKKKTAKLAQIKHREFSRNDKKKKPTDGILILFICAVLCIFLVLLIAFYDIRNTF